MAVKKRPENIPGTFLRYVGPEPDGFVPLPEGWPAADHEEGDERVRAEKLASGHYETGSTRPKELNDGDRD